MSFAPPVIVKLPENLTVENSDLFLSEVQSRLQSNRPFMVFDFADVRHFDSAGVATLLSCLEEVLKRNGDLKLAAISESSAMTLEVTGVDRLFEIFENADDAVDSFYRIPGYQFDDSSAAYVQNTRSLGQNAI